MRVCQGADETLWHSARSGRYAFPLLSRLVLATPLQAKNAVDTVFCARLASVQERKGSDQDDLGRKETHVPDLDAQHRWRVRAEAWSRVRDSRRCRTHARSVAAHHARIRADHSRKRVTMTRMLLILDLDDDDVLDADYSTDELTDALAARLGPEACYDHAGNPIRGRLVAAADITDADGYVSDALTIAADIDDDEARDRGLDPSQVETLWVAAKRIETQIDRDSMDRAIQS